MALQPEREEYLNPYLRRYWLENGRVIVYQPIPGGDMLKLWFNAVLQGLQEWDADRPALPLHSWRRRLVRSLGDPRRERARW